MELNRYRRLDDPKIAGPERTLENARIVKEEWDGLYTLFVELEGRWYYRIYH